VARGHTLKAPGKLGQAPFLKYLEERCFTRDLRGKLFLAWQIVFAASKEKKFNLPGNLKNSKIQFTG